ncbi:MAG: hypothetical protein PVI87_02905 [Gammaproteobacteria bacterium]|jgi:hypothetical protein
MICRGLTLLAMLGVTMLVAPATAQQPQPAPPAVRDLAWGEVLFRHYQEDRMGALVRLAVAEARAELPHHGGEARLLQGGLYLAWGLRDEAASIFEALLADGAPPAQQDQAWYWLARIRHERGEVDAALAALHRIGDDLPPAMAADRVDLESRVLLALGRYDAVVRLLASSRQPGAWRAFADFNQAVALARTGETDAALELFDDLGRSRADREELLLLRDRANLALGLARLDGGDPAGARTALDRVRLDSPYAGRALLAAGWAEAEREHYRAALGPWTQLTGLGDADGAALEAMLAVPWAWHQVDEPGQSVLGYRQAAAACEAELARLDTALRTAQGEALLELALADPAEPPIVEGPLPAYLHALSVDHPFRAVTADLRDLKALRENLLEWRRSLDALRDMVEARRARFAQVAPRVEQRLAEDHSMELARRHETASGRLAAARAADEPSVLATPAEKALLERIASLAARIAGLPDGEARESLQERVRRVDGALAWQLNHAWPARLHEAEQELRAAARALEAAREQRASLAASLAAGPAGFEGYAVRIDAAEARVERLLVRVEADQARRQGALRALAVEELQRREQLVAAYLGQARFALAAAYDQAVQPRAARGDDAPPTPGTGP